MRLPYWSSIRTIGNSPTVKATILIPVIGYMILFNARIAEYLALPAELAGFGEWAPSPISPRLMMIYFGLCFIALGAAIYALACPIIAKRYGNANDFVAECQPNLGSRTLNIVCEELKNSPSAGEFDEYVSKRNRIIDRSLSQQDSAQADFERNVLTLYYFDRDESGGFWRAMSLACYILGFMTLGIPSADIFYRVFRLLIQTLTS
jgi:hypothetical protein